MPEQLDLFAVQLKKANDRNPYQYSTAVGKITQILSVFPDAALNTSFSYNKGNLAIAFFSPPGSPDKCMWITLGARANKLEVKYSYYLVVDTLMAQRDSVTQNSMHRVQYTFSDIEAVTDFSAIIRAIYEHREREASGRTFDCCHRYLQCSDAKDCTHPDQNYAMGCTYRRQLKQNSIFYGENCNID